MLAERVATEAAAEVASIAPGRAAVIAPEVLIPALASALVDVGFPTVDPQNMRKGGLSEPLVLLAADAVNGLEFDSVVVVEPGIIAGETARGLRTLYVALTRPTQKLVVIHRAPLPAALTSTS
jgi:superfamily I DNA/RNA helicase